MFRGETNDDSLWLGIEKGDHAGWWYIARLSDCPEGCLIDGEIVYDPDHISERGSKKESVPGEIFTWIFMVIAYVIIFIPAMIAGIIYWIYEKVKGVKTKEEYLDIFMRDYLNCTKFETE